MRRGVASPYYFDNTKNMDMSAAVTALAALANPSRLGIFRHLVELGPEGACPGDLVQKFDLPGATLSFHLKNLAQAGLIEAERSSRNILYRANFQEMQGLVDFLTRNCCGGDPGKCAPEVRVPARKRTA
ncbi:DNA-binding transcriptional ArsR family regulator [Lysobacter ruishenii]|uniref:DNA-binding transcriptional ArsR family regulator n=2 Tax=Aerolutibacter ruishenii TaxID=686800 RepID=A0A562M338_9GAMM|nr:DNA-binding transcriptional ArsR family regulator [Lysobacter ruishenii]